MTSAAVLERVRHLSDVRADAAAPADSVKSALADARRLESWLHSQVAALVTRLAEIDSYPEAAIAEADRCSLASASKKRERSSTLSNVPSLAGALDDGAVTAGHIDAISRRSKQLDADKRNELMNRLDALTDVASAATIEQFDKRIQLEVKKLRSDDGEDRLTRQKQDMRLSTWTDVDGMWCLRGRFDPESALGLSATITNATETLFAESVPEHCPSDPVEKQKFLAAHALRHLLDAPAASAGSSRSRRPEYVAVIDADAPVSEQPCVRWPIPIELPARVIADMVGSDRVDAVGVVVRNGVIVHAPGELDLGRSTRLANRAQRRALRGLYPGCAIPGCGVSYDRCKLHHLIWWRHGGRTDLDNLLPVCTKHHGNIHHDDWVVELGPHRELTLRLPDGTVRSSGPPSIRDG